MKMPTLGIMQPYFIPYWGYFSHIHQCDFWVVFDEPRYSRRTWMNRNDVCGPQGKPQRISVPVTFGNSQAKKIRDAVVQEAALQPEWLVRKLLSYRKAPFYDAVIEMVHKVYHALDSDKLSHFNVQFMAAICNYLGIQFNYVYSSQLDYDINRVTKSGDWAFEISKALKVETYLNPISGLPIFEVSKFRSADIELKFLKTEGFPFLREGIQSDQHYSVLDTLFHCSAASIIERQASHIDVLSWEEASEELKGSSL